MEHGIGFFETLQDGVCVENLQFYDAFESDNRLLFSCQKFNGLYCYDREKGVVELVDTFKNEDIHRCDLHRCVFEVDEQLYFIPYYGKNIHITDLDGKNQRWIEIADDSQKSPHYSNAFLINDEIWIMPFFLDNPLIRFNTKTWEISKNYIIRDFIKRDYMSLYESYIDVFCSDIGDKYIYFSLIGNNLLFYISIEECICSILSILSKDIKIRCIKCLEDHIYLTNTNDYRIVDYDYINEVSSIYELSGQHELIQYPFSRIIIHEERVIALAGYCDFCVVINPIEKKLDIIELNLPCDITRLSDGYALFTGVCFKKDTIELFPRGTNRLLTLDYNLKCINSEVVGISVSGMKNLVRRGYIEETENFSLNNYVNAILAKR